MATHFDATHGALIAQKVAVDGAQTGVAPTQWGREGALARLTSNEGARRASNLAELQRLSDDAQHLQVGTNAHMPLTQLTAVVRRQARDPLVMVCDATT